MNVRTLLSVIFLAVGSTALAWEPGTQIQADKFRPQWNVGDQWTVQTVTQQYQATVKQKPVRAQWRFAVEAQQKRAGRDCLRIGIRPTDAEEPKTTVWVDQKTGSIRQIQTQFPTRDGYKTVTESYIDQTGSAAPVIGPMTALPIDLPKFPEPGTKSLDTYSYTVVSGPGGVKALGEVGFTTEIRQGFSAPSAELLKSLGGDEEGIKSLQDQPLIEISLATSDYSARQIWGENSPWPLFSDNGVTETMLIKVERAAEADRGAEPEPAEPRNDDGLKNLESGTGMERGTADFKPWSGYWWPIRQGLLLVPLGKYDQLTGHQAAAWEQKHYPPGPNVPSWHGYCHAWAAGSVLENEPVKQRAYGVETARIDLNIGDQKGLLTACHTRDLANSWGDRFGDGQGSEDRQDLRPVLLWRLLKMHIGQRGVPLILDVEAGSEVWNFPVYQYQIKHKPTNDGRYVANLVVIMADDGVHPSYVGTKDRKQTYQFVFRMRDGNVVSGSSQWVGRSAQDHPDFAWYPFQAVAANPELDYPRVQRIVGAEQSQPTPPTPESGEEPSLPMQPEVQPIAEPTQPVEPSNAQPTQPVSTPSMPVGDPIVLSPIELVALIADQTSSFPFDATLDRFDGASYKPGEAFTMRVKSEQPGYLYLIQVDSSGTPSLLYPTASEDNRIPADELVEIKPAGSAGGFPVAGKAGTVRVKSIVVSRPLAFSGSVGSVQQQQQRPTSPPAQASGQQQSPTPAQQPATLPKPQANGQQTPATSQQKTGRQVPGATQQPTRQETPAMTQKQAQPQRAFCPIRFRWHPTQRRQIKQLLSQQSQQQPTTADQLGCRSPLDILGPFAQDMTVFYIDAIVAADKP